MCLHFTCAHYSEVNVSLVYNESEKTDCNNRQSKPIYPQAPSRDSANPKKDRQETFINHKDTTWLDEDNYGNLWLKLKVIDETLNLGTKQNMNVTLKNETL